MSFAITLFVREGIVMAADSRLTLNRIDAQPDGSHVHLAVGQTDSIQKLFLASNHVGISTYGDADIKGIPIAGFIETFLAMQLPEEGEVERTARALLEFFGKNDPVPATSFHVAGYAKSDGTVRQEVWLVDIRKGQCERQNKVDDQGACWGGELDILSRFLKRVQELDNVGKPVGELPAFSIPFAFFTLQDAVDFAIFATRSTIDAIRFQPRPKTVGGPIDVLVLRPKECKWIQRKQLHGEATSTT